MVVSIHWPLPFGSETTLVADEIARTYRQFGRYIGPWAVRASLIGEQVRHERVIAAFDDERPVGYLALRFDRIGPLTVRGQSFRREFGPMSGAVRFGIFKLVERRERSDEVHIDNFFVAARARGTGIGALLLARAEQIGRGVRKGVLRARVRADNPRAIAFYRRHGFVEESVSDISWLSQLAGTGQVLDYAKRLT